MNEISDFSPAKQLLQRNVVIINMGLTAFLNGLESKDIKFVHVDWRPPARGNPELMAALRKLSSKDSS